MQPRFRSSEVVGNHECVRDARQSGERRKDISSLSVTFQPRESAISVEINLMLSLVNLDKFELYFFFTSSFRATEIILVSQTPNQFHLDTTHQSNHNYNHIFSDLQGLDLAINDINISMVIRYFTILFFKTFLCNN